MARADLVKAGYEPKTVRLHYDPSDAALISAACQRHQAEMLAWAAGHRPDTAQFDGTLASLIRRYQHDEASPYKQIKWNTRRVYDQTLGMIEKAFGKRSLAALKNSDFQRWYDKAKEPTSPGAPERVNRAYKIVSLLRRLFSFGIAAELPQCVRLKLILDNMTFAQPGRRDVSLERQHVEAFVAAALEMDRLSLAIGTALQFEAALRQRDVISEWVPQAGGDSVGGIMLRGRRWANGLTWA